ncbi:MAG: hypothetical protein HC824_16640 [Synechococcales cyanobacterium RM1_1_8]|nr:hypothetical protein [Synechococcales cyanobacterium RM1_1_8]
MRYLDNGELEYLGRIDNQVKIRGFRIELGGIEARLAQHPSLEDGIVMAREDQPGQKQLVAYLLPKAGQRINLEALRQHLSKALPHYMIPAAFVVLDVLPMTPSGKVDRKALPAPALEEAVLASEGDFVAPSTKTEQQLVQIWEALLQRSPVGVSDNFLELGGDSLLAMGLILQIEQQFGHRLSLSGLFQHPTIASLAPLLEGAAIAPKTCVMSLSTGTDSSRLPLFFVNCAQDASGVARQLGDRYRVYGLNLFGASERLYAIRDRLTLTDLAQVFIADLRQVQPQGPYCLASYCGDTRLLLELAEELRRQGETVGLLAMIDPWWDQSSIPLAYHLNTLKHFGGDYLVEKVKHRLGLVQKRLSWMGDRLSAQFRRRFAGSLSGSLSGSISAPESSALELDIALFSAFERATRAYQPQPYGGPSLILLSEELHLNRATAIEQDVLATFPSEQRQLKVVPGYHQNLFQPPSLGILVQHLGEAIDRASPATERIQRSPERWPSARRQSQRNA